MKRSKFSLSNQKLLSCDLGELVPIGLTQVIPGDSIQQATSCMVRLAPMLAPVMHPTHIQLSHWFVPHRLIWDDFEDFITGGPQGTSIPDFPTITMPAVTGAAVGSLADYLGVPTGFPNLEVSALPFRGYNLIWNEWYRDQDLQTELIIETASGPDPMTATVLQNSAWEKDYFTEARPFEQKGPAITIPLGTSAPVVTDGTYPAIPLRSVPTGVNSKMRAGAAGVVLESDQTLNANAGVAFGQVNPLGLQANLEGASAITVGRLREALALQRYEEARARFGSRYVEYLRYLGVRSADARLQRPEYLGGGRYPIQFSEVVQTAEGSDPVGELRGHGIGAARSNRFRRYIEEHGYIFTLMTVKPRTIYMQGLARHWNYRSKEDFFQRELQHIGQQEILNKEVYAGHTNRDGVFGYGDRYDELRRAFSSVSGEMRTTLNFWHFARQFTSDPALNADFVKAVPTENPFAVPSADVLYITARHSIQARRLVSASATSFIY